MSDFLVSLPSNTTDAFFIEPQQQPQQQQLHYLTAFLMPKLKHIRSVWSLTRLVGGVAASRLLSHLANN